MDGLISIAEFVKLTGLSRSSVYRMIDDGRIPKPAKIGDDGSKQARRVWRKSVVSSYLDSIMPSADTNA